MTLQPAEQLAPDAELVVTGIIRTALSGRAESYTSNVRVSNAKAGPSARQVVVRRDGGPQRGLFDFPRLGVRVWAATEQDATDLALMAQAILLNSPGHPSGIVQATSLSGPSPVPDAAGPHRYFTVELKIRCVNL
jgi:hypothetical protein